MKNQQMGQNLDRIAKAIAYEAIYVKNVRDNTTVMIIGLGRGLAKI